MSLEATPSLSMQSFLPMCESNETYLSPRTWGGVFLLCCMITPLSSPPNPWWGGAQGSLWSCASHLPAVLLPVDGLWGQRQQSPWSFSFLAHSPWPWPMYVCIPHPLNKLHHLLKPCQCQCLKCKRQKPKKEVLSQKPRLQHWHHRYGTSLAPQMPFNFNRHQLTRSKLTFLPYRKKEGPTLSH